MRSNLQFTESSGEYSGRDSETTDADGATGE